MARSSNAKKGQAASTQEGISQITVSGYKSIAKEQSIEIRPLTILAGANSSGKSSMIQPLLLLKQTLESTFDPGALWLNGPNVRFTAAEQFLTRRKGAEPFCIDIGLGNRFNLKFCFAKTSDKKGIEVREESYQDNRGTTIFRPGMASGDIAELPLVMQAQWTPSKLEPDWFWSIQRNRFFLVPILTLPGQGVVIEEGLPPSVTLSIPEVEFNLRIEAHIRNLIHVAGLRGNPERAYPRTAVGSMFPGTFESYIASIITQWQETQTDKLDSLGDDLKWLGLTWKVTARRIGDTAIELLIGRLPYSTRGGAKDMVNIADVGLGVSQTLPVLVALQVAQPGQLVYLEQPETHLHPRAQQAMAQILANAALRGVRVVVETHSDTLLLGIQTLVAEGKLPADLVKLHWFERDDDGFTKITSADLDNLGAFNNWPQDFGEVELKSRSRYLDAVERQLDEAERQPGND